MIEPDLAMALERAAASRVLAVGSDYDGTLSPIVADPSQAIPDRAALDALITVSTMPLVHGVVVSGRSQEVLAELTGAPPSLTLIGNHGAGHGEHGGGVRPVPPLSDRLDELADELRAVSAQFAGSEVEVKSLGVALHYRNASGKRAVAELAREVGRRYGGRIIDGKMVVEIVLAEGDKGTAIEAFRSQHGADAVVFFGDDTTDEDVFVKLHGIDVGVKVGEGRTAAAFRIDDPGSVGEALRMLGSLRGRVSE